MATGSGGVLSINVVKYMFEKNQLPSPTSLEEGGKKAHRRLLK
jgi:hypothetical protein